MSLNLQFSSQMFKDSLAEQGCVQKWSSHFESAYINRAFPVSPALCCSQRRIFLDCDSKAFLTQTSVLFIRMAVIWFTELVFNLKLIKPVCLSTLNDSGWLRTTLMGISHYMPIEAEMSFFFFFQPAWRQGLTKTPADLLESCSSKYAVENWKVAIWNIILHYC